VLGLHRITKLWRKLVEIIERRRVLSEGAFAARHSIDLGVLLHDFLDVGVLVELDGESHHKFWLFVYVLMLDCDELMALAFMGQGWRLAFSSAF